MRLTRHLWGDAGAKYFHTAGVIIPDNNLVNLQFCNLLSFPQLCKSKWWFHESLQRIDKFISRVGKESPQGVGEGREAKLLSLSLTVACTYLSLTVSQLKWKFTDERPILAAVHMIVDGEQVPGRKSNIS